MEDLNTIRTLPRDLPMAREIEGLALLVMNQLYAQHTGSKKLRNDDVMISLCA
jgi:hypothetical protein